MPSINQLLCLAEGQVERINSIRTESEAPIKMSTFSTTNQSPRAKYSSSGTSNNSRPVILNSADTLIFPMLGALSEDVSIDDVDNRRALIASSHRAPQRCAKLIELPPQRTDERLLEVPSLSTTHRSKKYGDYWTPNSKQ